MSVHVFRYPLNRLLCWHGRGARRLLRYSNGIDIYCSACMRKRLAVMDDALTGSGGTR
jgi:hypothetical protein